MPKRQPTRTSKSRKGKKLQGLTPFEASRRAKKGWETRHRLHGLLTRPSTLKTTSRTGDDFADDEFDVPGGRREASTHQGLHIEEMGWKERAAWEAKEFAQGRPLSKEFEDVLQNVPSEEKAAFMQRVQAYERLQSRIHTAGTEVEDPMIGTAGSEQAGEIVRKRGLELQKFISHSPDETGTVPIKIEDPKTDPLTRGGLEPGVIRSKVSESQLRARVDSALNSAFTLPDPTHKEASKPRSIKHISAKEHQILTKYIVQSHFGTSTAERMIARDRAERLVKQVSARAAPRAQKIADEQHVRDLETKLRIEEAGPPHRRAVSVEQAIQDKGVKSSTKPLYKPTAQGRPVGERRLGGTIHPFTAEDQYEASGHEDGSLPRRKRMKAQVAFNKAQLQYKYDALKSGDLTLGKGPKGEAVKPDDAAIRLSPNKVWNYRLEDPNNPLGHIDQTLPYWDTKTKHAPSEVIAETSAPRFARDGTAFSAGARQLKTGETKLLPYESEEVIIPLRNVTKSSRHLKTHEEGNFTVRQVMDVHGRWQDATPQEYAAAKSSIGEPDPITGERQTAGRFREIRAEKQKKITFADPSDLVRKHKERDELSFAKGNRVVDVDLAQFGSGRVEDAVYRYHAAKGEHELRTRSEVTAFKQRKHGNSYAAKDVLAAGGFATYYGAQKRIRQGYAPAAANRTWEGFLSKNSRTAGWAKSHNLESARFGVKEGLIQPGLSHIANLGFQIKHPFSSPSGTTLGVDWGSVAYREGRLSQWIPANPDRIAARKLKRQGNRVTQVANTEDFLWKNTYRPGVRGALARHRAEPVKRWSEYKSFHDEGGLLERSAQMAQLPRKGPHEQEAATKLLTDIGRVAATHTQRNQPGLVTDLVPYVGKRGTLDRLAHADLSGGEKKLLVGGAVVGTALGAHYLYHKHQEKNKTPEERTSYYNKILPGRIEVPSPTLRTTGHYRLGANNVLNEFNLSGKRVPVRFGVGAKRKTIWKGSPEDRGYAKNAKILGGIGGPRARGGSLKESVFFDQASTGTRRRSFVPVGGQLVVAGTAIPVRADIGKRRKVELSRTNPNRLTNKHREDIIWAFKGTPEEHEVKQFYSYGKRDRIVDMFDDPDVLSRIRKNRGLREGAEIARHQAAPVVTGPDIDEQIQRARMRLEELQRVQRAPSGFSDKEPTKEEAIFFSTQANLRGRTGTKIPRELY